MRLSKRASQLIGLGVIVLFFVVASLTSRNTVPPEERNQLTDSASTKVSEPTLEPSAHPQSQFELNDFRRSSVKDGVKVWEVIAQRGTYDPQTSEAQLFDASIEITRKNGENLQIKADSATISLNGNELVQAELSGNVRTQLDKETTVITERAKYSLQNQEIITQAPVKIENSMLDITADRLQTNTEDQIITLTGNVTTLLQPASQRKKKGVDNVKNN